MKMPISLDNKHCFFCTYSANTKLKLKWRTGYKSMILIWEKDRYMTQYDLNLLLRDRPLEKLWEWGGEFSRCMNFFVEIFHVESFFFR